jgi:hypothetical protein
MLPAIKWRVSDCSQGYGIEDERRSQHAANRPAQEPNRVLLVHDDRSPMLPAKPNDSRGQKVQENSGFIFLEVP